MTNRLAVAVGVLLAVSLLAGIGSATTTAGSGGLPTAATDSPGASVEWNQTVQTFRGSSHPPWAQPCSAKRVRTVTFRNTGEEAIDLSSVALRVDGNRSVYGYAGPAFTCGDGTKKAFPEFAAINDRGGSLEPGESIEIVGYGVPTDAIPQGVDGKDWVVDSGNFTPLTIGGVGDVTVTPLSHGNEVSLVDRSSGRTLSSHTVTEPLHLAQVNLGSVFEPDQRPRLTIGTQAERVSWRVSDVNGRIVARGSAGVDHERTIGLDVSNPGYYAVTVRAHRDGRVWRSERTSIAVVPAERPPADPFFGMGTHFGNRQRWDLNVTRPIVLSGADHIRDEQRWANVQSASGEFAFDGHNAAYMRAADRADLEPLIILAYGNRHFIEPWHGAPTAPYTDDQRQAYLEYGQAVLSQYGDQVQTVEVWNEYNIERFAKGPAASPEGYATLLEAVYPGLKEQRPDVRVAAGATSEMDFEWWRGVVEAGGAQYLDVASIHPYRNSPTGLESDVATLRGLFEDHGEAPPIWITELGWSTHRSGYSEATQSAYLVRSHARAAAAGVERYYWYDFRDDLPPGASSGLQFGLLRHPASEMGGYSPKPSYAAYATMTRTLAGASFDGTDDDRPDAVRSYRFTREGTPIRVLWSMDGDRSVTLQTDDPVTVQTATGRTQELQPTEGAVYLTLSETPVYVTGRVDSITAGAPVGVEASTGVTGETLPLALHSSLSSPVGFRVGEESFRVSGDRRAVVADGAYEPGLATVLTTVTADGDPVGLLATRTEFVADPVVGSIDPRVHADGSSDLALTLRSVKPGASYTVTGVQWRVAGESGRADTERELTAGANATIDLSAAFDRPWKRTNVRVVVSFADRPDLAIEETVTVAPISRVEHTVDGSLDEVAGVRGIHLREDGRVRLSADDGPADLSGTVWLTHDDEHLYLSANVTDDEATAGTPLWRHDSVQLGVAPGRPETARGFAELTVGRTPDGPRVFRGIQPDGTSERLTEADLAIERRDGQTYYELAVPWSALNASPEGPVSVSLLVNDNDGDGRAGWIEWGGGIGSGKDASQFRSVTFLDGMGATAVATTPGTETTGVQTTPTAAPGTGVLGAILALAAVTLARRRRV